MSSGAEWQVGPNLKDKPGSQGTLLRGGTQFMSDRRYPRGYTPERQAEVNEALGHLQAKSYLTNKGPGGHPGTGPDRRLMNQTIMRSTVPAEHIEGIQFHPGQVNLRSGRPSADDPFEGRVSGLHHSGVYQWRSGSVSDMIEARKQGLTPKVPIKPASISIAKGDADSSTVIHEIGHEFSQRMNTEHSEYRTPEQRGREEAYADEYAQKHYRARGQTEPDTWKSIYGMGWRTASRPDEFYQAYHAVRGTKDMNWDEPTEYQLQRGREKANDDASALIHAGDPIRSWNTYHRKAVLNPDALPS